MHGEGSFNLIVIDKLIRSQLANELHLFYFKQKVSSKIGLESFEIGESLFCSFKNEGIESIVKVLELHTYQFFLLCSYLKPHDSILVVVYRHIREILQ